MVRARTSLPVSGFAGDKDGSIGRGDFASRRGHRHHVGIRGAPELVISVRVFLKQSTLRFELRIFALEGLGSRRGTAR